MFLQKSSLEDLNHLKIMEPGHTMVLSASLGDETKILGDQMLSSNLRTDFGNCLRIETKLFENGNKKVYHSRKYT